MKKRRVKVELCENKKIYTGRLLGLIGDKEFHCITNKRSAQNKIFSSQTMPLEEITDNYTELNGLRIVLALKEVDGKEIQGKHLFISEKLNYIAHQTTNTKIGILGMNDEYYEVTENLS